MLLRIMQKLRINNTSEIFNTHREIPTYYILIYDIIDLCSVIYEMNTSYVNKFE